MATTLTPTFSPERIFIKPTVEADWKELKTVISDSITISSTGDPGAFESIRKPLTLSFSVRIDKRSSIRMQQAFGLLKAPRCTYKTIKRHCAKRNQHKR